MTTRPEPADLLAAADTLEKFNTYLKDLYQPDASWRPSELRREAPHLEAEIAEQAEKDAWTEEFSRAIYAAAFESQYRPDDGFFTQIARKLIENGWGKVT